MTPSHLDPCWTIWCQSICRHGVLGGSTLSNIMMKPFPNFILISSYVSTANLHPLMQMEIEGTKSCTGVSATSLNVTEAAQTRDYRITVWVTESLKTFWCLYELKYLLSFLWHQQKQTYLTTLTNINKTPQPFHFCNKREFFSLFSLLN